MNARARRLFVLLALAALLLAPVLATLA